MDDRQHVWLEEHRPLGPRPRRPKLLLLVEEGQRLALRIGDGVGLAGLEDDLGDAASQHRVPSNTQLQHLARRPRGGACSGSGSHDDRAAQRRAEAGADVQKEAPRGFRMLLPVCLIRNWEWWIDSDCWSVNQFNYALLVCAGQLHFNGTSQRTYAQQQALSILSIKIGRALHLPIKV